MQYLFKKDKPIMTETKHNDYLLETKEGQLNILNGLSSKNKERIGVWLDNVEVKKNVVGEPYIASPFWGSIYIYKDVSYLTLYEWCAVNFEKIRLVKLPKPLGTIIYYSNKWKGNPSIDPYTNKDIAISLNPNGEYVQLYIKIMDGLVSNILETKTNKVLSIKDCHKIKDSLPNKHARVLSDRSSDIYQIYYDYLFIVYFIKSKTIQYDTAFQSELNIYLDLAVYNTSSFVYNDEEQYIEFHYTTEYLYIRKFLKNYLQNMSESEISIQVLVKKLCIDIENTMIYIREPNVLKIKNITSTEIDKINFNINVLKYCITIFDNIPEQYVEEYVKNPQGKNKYVLIKEFLLSELTKNEENIQEYKDISDRIMIHMEDVEVASSNVFATFISIYNSILKLYNNNKFNKIYKNYIRDPYNKGIEPPIPVKQELSKYLLDYKLLLSNLENAVKAAASKSSKERKQQELDDFKEKNLSKDEKLKEEDEKINRIFNEKMKDYKFKKFIYDRNYESKYSPKKRKKLLSLSLNVYKRFKTDEPLLKVSSRKTNSDGIRSFGSLKHYGNMKEPGDYSSSYNEVSGYYINDTDPYTLETFSSMHPKKQKYSSDIVYNDGKNEYHYRFDTINIYNYILKCIDVCDKPINCFNRSEFTPNNLDEICNKIKHFTKKPTYNSSSDIIPLLKNCSKYDNFLAFTRWSDIKEERKHEEIIGNIYIHLNIKLGSILFEVIEGKVLTLPIFNSNISERFPYYNKYQTDIIRILGDKLLVGELIGSRFFPYRTTKSILNLPEFAFEMTDGAEKTLKKLKRYKEK